MFLSEFHQLLGCVIISVDTQGLCVLREHVTNIIKYKHLFVAITEWTLSNFTNAELLSLFSEKISLETHSFTSEGFIILPL
jgi:hypothetical protein